MCLASMNSLNAFKVASHSSGTNCKLLSVVCKIDMAGSFMGRHYIEISGLFLVSVLLVSTPTCMFIFLCVRVNSL
jgi:hypothetical protein